jgi:hypothetical protein
MKVAKVGEVEARLWASANTYLEAKGAGLSQGLQLRRQVPCRGVQPQFILKVNEEGIDVLQQPEWGHLVAEKGPSGRAQTVSAYLFHIWIWSTDIGPDRSAGRHNNHPHKRAPKDFAASSEVHKAATINTGLPKDGLGSSDNRKHRGWGKSQGKRRAALQKRTCVAGQVEIYEPLLARAKWRFGLG